MIRTIIRLSSTLSPAWEVVEDEACHMLLHEGPLTAAPTGAGGVRPRCVRVCPRGQDAGTGELQRPIRAEDLVALLNAEGARLVPLAAMVVTPMPVAAPSPAAPAVRSAAGQPQAKLRQWPPFAVLKGRPRALQLATHLSRAAHGAESLARGTGQTLAECQAFLDQMDALGLLDWQALPVAAQANRPAPSRGLLQSIRRKLRLA